MLRWVAGQHFPDDERLIVWVIDRQRVRASVIDEPGADRPDLLFPHIYGPLNLDAVVDRAILRRGWDGAWQGPLDRSAPDPPSQP